MTYILSLTLGLTFCSSNILTTTTRDTVTLGNLLSGMNLTKRWTGLKWKKYFHGLLRLRWMRIGIETEVELFNTVIVPKVLMFYPLAAWAHFYPTS